MVRFFMGNQMKEKILKEARLAAGSELICTGHFRFDKPGEPVFCANAAADAVIKVLEKHFKFVEKKRASKKTKRAV